MALHFLSLVAVLGEHDVDANDAAAGRHEDSRQFQGCVELQLVQANHSHHDVVEEQADLIYRHELHLVVVLDPVVYVDEGSRASVCQAEEEADGEQVVCPLFGIFQDAADNLHEKFGDRRGHGGQIDENNEGEFDECLELHALR